MCQINPVQLDVELEAVALELFTKMLDKLDDLVLINLISFLSLRERFRVMRVCKRVRCMVIESLSSVDRLVVSHDYPRQSISCCNRCSLRVSGMHWMPVNAFTKNNLSLLPNIKLMMAVLEWKTDSLPMKPDEEGIFEFLLKNCRKLEFLKLALPSHCTYHEHHLKHLHSESVGVDQSVINSIISNSLQVLEVKIKEVHEYPLIVDLPQLQVLKLIIINYSNLSLPPDLTPLFYSKAITVLEEIDLYGDFSVDRATQEFQAPNLKILDVKFNPLHQTTLNHLSKFSPLTHLTMGFTPLIPFPIQTLEYVHLIKTTDAQVEAVCRANPLLREVTLHSMTIHDECFQHLSLLPRLADLKLYKKRVFGSGGNFSGRAVLSFLQNRSSRRFPIHLRIPNRVNMNKELEQEMELQRLEGSTFDFEENGFRLRNY